MLLAVLVASAFALCIPADASSELRVRVALIDPAGKDVTKEAGAPGREIEIVTWVRDVHDLEMLLSPLGAHVAVASPESIVRHVALAYPEGVRNQIPEAEPLLAPGWLFAGDTCPSITLYPGESGERVLPLRVSRARRVEVTFALPAEYREENLFSVWGASVVDQGEPRVFEYWAQDPAAAKAPPRLTVDVPEGRHSLWAVADSRDRSGPRLWAHEELVVDATSGQRITMTFRPSVEVRGRLVDRKGKPVGHSLVLTARELTSTWSRPGAGWRKHSSPWITHSRSDGSFVLDGLPPGRELVGLDLVTPRVRVPDAGGDLGDLVLDSP